jgi:hypothetical protein
MGARIHFESAHTAIPSNNITGNGTINQVAKFTGANVIGDSIITDDGTGVGIGTALPTAKLEIVDTSNPEATSGSVIIEGRRDGAANVLTLRAKDASAPAAALPDGQGPVVRFQGFDGTDFENMGYIQVAAQGQAVANADAPSFMALGVSADGSSTPTERMRIASNGNVGIGTNLPEGKLHVLNGSAGSVTANGNADEFIVENSSTGGLSILTPDASTGYIIFGSPADNEGAIIRYQPTGTLMTIGTEVANGALAFRTASGTERMRIDSTGNVGIGTSAPNVQLEVSAANNSLGGIFRLNNNRTSLFDGDQNGSIQFSNNEISGGANGVRSAILSLVRDTAGKTDLAFTTASSNGATTEKVRILADGGLTFNGDTAAANALDDYEEGTWTPSITFGGASTGITYASNGARYTKVGRQVSVTCYILMSNKGLATGNARIAGLPFASAAGNPFYSTASLSAISAMTYLGMAQAYVNVGATNIDLVQTTELGAQSGILDTNFSNGTQLIMSATYFV